MPGLAPIQVFRALSKTLMAGNKKPGHDEYEISASEDEEVYSQTRALDECPLSGQSGSGPAGKTG